MQGRDPVRFRRKGGSGSVCPLPEGRRLFPGAARTSSAEKGGESSGPAKGQLDGSQEELQGRRRRRGRTAWSERRGKEPRRRAGDGRRVRGGRSLRRGAADRLSCFFRSLHATLRMTGGRHGGEPRRHVVAGAMFLRGGGFGSGPVTIRKTGRSGVSRAFFGLKTRTGEGFCRLCWTAQNG